MKIFMTVYSPDCQYLHIQSEIKKNVGHHIKGLNPIFNLRRFYDNIKKNGVGDFALVF